MIYILCPAHTVTGGTEALYQLGNALQRMGKEVALYLTNRFGKAVNNRLQKEYNVPWVEDADIKKEDTIIVPEIYIDVLKNLDCKKYIWWLSVDNAKWSDGFWKNDSDIFHLAQSEYARKYLENLGIKSIWLSDYINDVYTQTPHDVQREEMVLFNTAKGFANVSEIIRNAQGGIKWVAIKNMDVGEIAYWMNIARVYIDLGHCPGKDRMPREALACGCRIITSKLGGFGNDVDIPIADRWKVETFDEVYPKLTELLNAEHVEGFDKATVQVLGEKERFFEDVKRIFC